MATIFTKIINGELPCYKVAEDDKHIAFLDISPLKFGHVLAVPKNEVDYIFDLADEDLAALTIFSKKVAKAMGEILSCSRIGVAVIGLEVPHTHIHLIPINNVGDINFSNPKAVIEADKMTTLAGEISTAFEKL